MTKKEDDSRILITGDSEGRVIQWQTEHGTGTQVSGKGPDNQINALAHEGRGDSVVVAGIDDTIRRISAGEFTDFSAKLDSQPRAVRACGDDGVTAVATVSKLMLLSPDGTVRKELSVDYEPSSLAFCPQLHHLAVGDGGSTSTGAVRVYSAADLEEVKTAKATGAVTSLAYSPDGRFLVAGDANRRVTLLSAPEYEKAHAKEWGFHSAKVTCVAWSPDSRFLASGGLDCAVILWSVEQPQKHHTMQSAHTQSQVRKRYEVGSECLGT